MDFATRDVACINGASDAAGVEECDVRIGRGGKQSVCHHVSDGAFGVFADIFVHDAHCLTDDDGLGGFELMAPGLGLVADYFVFQELVGNVLNWLVSYNQSVTQAGVVIRETYYRSSLKLYNLALFVPCHVHAT